jgi:xanthine dehydrogenase accessory factor
MNLETARTALSLLEQGEDFAWVSILGTKGSSPRHSGADMLVRADGSIAGTIGGGPLEATCIAQAAEVMRTRKGRLMEFDSGRLGMACGGSVQVLMERIDATDEATRDLLAEVLDLWQSGRRGWLVTAVQRQGEEDVTVRRSLADSCSAVAGEHVQQIGTQGAAYIFGAGHCGQSLAPVLSNLGFYTVVIDDRSDFANRGRFPTADRIEVPESFEGVVRTLPVDEDSYLVIVTRGHAHDKSVLAQALRTPAAYIGMIGSTRKVADTFKSLGEQGFSADDIARVHAPIGLPIGAETPEEIAISIAAQLVQVRAAKDG